MNLLDYGRIILRRGWIAILLAVVTAVAAYGFSQIVTPVYRGTQTVLLVPVRSDLGLTEAALRLINSRQAYLNSELIAQQVIEDLELDMTPGYLLGETTIVPNRDSLAIQIDVDLPAESGQEASALIGPIVAAWGQELIDYQNELNQSARQEDRIQARIQDNPRVYQLQPNTRIYTAIGAIGGLFIGVLIIFVLEYLESNIIRRRGDIEATLEMKVLASIPFRLSLMIPDNQLFPHKLRYHHLMVVVLIVLIALILRFILIYQRAEADISFIPVAGTDHHFYLESGRGILDGTFPVAPFLFHPGPSYVFAGIYKLTGSTNFVLLTFVIALIDS